MKHVLRFSVSFIEGLPGQGAFSLVGCPCGTRLPTLLLHYKAVGLHGTPHLKRLLTFSFRYDWEEGLLQSDRAKLLVSSSSAISRPGVLRSYGLRYDYAGCLQCLRKA